MSSKKTSYIKPAIFSVFHSSFHTIIVLGSTTKYYQEAQDKRRKVGFRVKTRPKGLLLKINLNSYAY